MILRAPIRNFSKTRHHARTTTPITQNEQTPCCSLFPTCAYHASRLTLYSGMHGYLDRKSTAHRMIRSDQSRTWYFPWNSAQRHQRRGDDHHQTMMCVPCAYHVNRLLLQRQACRPSSALNGTSSDTQRYERNNIAPL